MREARSAPTGWPRRRPTADDPDAQPHVPAVVGGATRSPSARPSMRRRTLGRHAGGSGEHGTARIVPSCPYGGWRLAAGGWWLAERTSALSRPRRRSLQLHVPDHRAELVHLTAQDRLLFGGGRAHRLGAELDQPLGDAGVLHCGHHFAVQAVDDFLGRFRGREDAVPAFELDAHLQHVGAARRVGQDVDHACGSRRSRRAERSEAAAMALPILPVPAMPTRMGIAC